MNQETYKRPFYDHASFNREEYGEVLHRIPLDLGFACPTQANVEGNGRCIYCSTEGARAAHIEAGMPLRQQVELGIDIATKRYGATAFMAYFQAFTATNAPIDQLREKISYVLDLAPFRVVIVSTRPDCLPPETIDFLAELTETVDVWVEIGVQTANEKTLQSIQRGHDFICAATACRNLAARGIYVAAHVILGLPGEKLHDFRSTAERLSELPFAGIKIHNLHIVKGALLADLWRENNVKTMDEHEYGEVLMDFLRRIPPEWVVMRLVSDTAPHNLLAPHWWMTKGQFVQYVERQMHQRAWRQGDLYGRTGQDSKSAVIRTRLMTADEKPLLSCSNSDGAFSRLLQGTVHGFPLPSESMTVISSGFGLGSLGLEVLHQMSVRCSHRCRLVALGTDPSCLTDARRLFPDCAPILNALEFLGKYGDSRMRVGAYWGDPRKNVFRLRGTADLLVLEPDQFDANVIFGSLDYLRRLVRLLDANGILVSSCSSYAFRGTLCRLGLAVGTAGNEAIPGGGTVAAWDAKLLKYPLSEREMRILNNTLSGIPYRDLSLTWTRKRIIQHREKVLQRLRLRGWRKRLEPDDG